MILLTVEGLTIRYGDTTVVDNLGFQVSGGESIGIVGESGSGKTQTALALLGLLPSAAAAEGKILVGETEVLGADEAALNRLRARKIAMVFQDPMQALNPHLRIGAQLRLILAAHGIAAGRNADARVLDMLRRVGLPDPERQFRAYPHQLSGGMRQRAMIASALIAGPDILVADEPTTALDVTVQAQILDLLEAIRENTALLLITHDMGVVAGRCERMLVLESGRLVEAGRTADVFSNPQHEHTARLIAAAPRLDRGEVLAPVSGDAVLGIDDISVAYREPGGVRLQAVSGIDLSVTAGETVAVVGESGSGKSSLVHAILGLVPPQSGRVTFCGATIPASLKGRARALRRDLQLVFQDPVGSLNPRMRVMDIVAEPLLVHEPGISAAGRTAAATTMLQRVGLDDSYLQRFPHELSGGQAQRVAIARALILEPKVLICDEAVAALDGRVRERILDLLRDVQQETGLAIVFITHDLAVVRSMSHRVLVMYLGRVVELAASEELFASALHPYTRALLNAVPVPDPREPGGAASISGETPSALLPPPGCAFHTRCPHAAAVCANELPEQRLIDGITVACHRVEEIRGY